ncbi:MAG TPA: hypothetical protein ACFCUY_15990, partial [Xenococcaceae cyanobacterium]
IDEVRANTDQWLGKTITVTGTVEQLLEGSAFTMENEAYLDADRLLVINRSGEPIPELPETDIALQVTGRVAKVDQAEFIEDIDVDFPATAVDEFTNQPAIYADSIILAPDPKEVIETPANFYNREVAIEGEVAAVLNSNTFTLAQHSYALPEDRDLLVLNLTSEPIPAEQAEVVIRGVVRPYDRQQLEQDYGEQLFTAESDEKYTNAGVLIVESIAEADIDFSEVEVEVTP